VIALLLEAKARPTDTGQQGRSALELAATGLVPSLAPGVLTALIRAGSHPNEAVAIACTQRHAEPLLHVLLTHGAKVEGVPDGSAAERVLQRWTEANGTLSSAIAAVGKLLHRRGELVAAQDAQYKAAAACRAVNVAAIKALADATGALEKTNSSYRTFLSMTAPPEDSKKDKKKSAAASKTKAKKADDAEDDGLKDRVGGSIEVLNSHLQRFLAEFPEFSQGPPELSEEDLAKMRDKLESLHNAGQEHKLPEALVKGYAQMGIFLSTAVGSRTEQCETASKKLRDTADKVATTRSTLVALQTEVATEGPPAFTKIIEDFEQEGQSVPTEVKWWFWSLLDFARSCRETVAKLLESSTYDSEKVELLSPGPMPYTPENLETRTVSEVAKTEEQAREQTMVARELAKTVPKVEAPADPANCPITKNPFNKPVVAADGYIYDEDAVKDWFKKYGVCSPVTGEELESNTLVPSFREVLSRDQ
jgi:hypothetical protein